MKSNLFKFFAMLFCVAVCAGFSSCSDDDDDDFGGLVGSWMPVGYMDEGEIVWETDPDEVLVFNADGTVASYDCGEVDCAGTYSVNGNTIVANMYDHAYPEDRWTEVMTYAISDGLLYLTYTEEDYDGVYSYTTVFRRI